MADVEKASNEVAGVGVKGAGGAGGTVVLPAWGVVPIGAALYVLYIDTVHHGRAVSKAIYAEVSKSKVKPTVTTVLTLDGFTPGSLVTCVTWDLDRVVDASGEKYVDVPKFAFSKPVDAFDVNAIQEALIQPSESGQRFIAQLRGTDPTARLYSRGSISLQMS